MSVKSYSRNSFHAFFIRFFKFTKIMNSYAVQIEKTNKRGPSGLLWIGLLNRPFFRICFIIGDIRL